MSGLLGGDRLEVAAVLSVTLYDIYMASTILGAGYVVVSAVLGNFHFSTSGDAGGGDVGGGTGGDIGHGGVDVGGGDVDAGAGDIGHDVTHDTGQIVDATDERRRAFSAFSPTIVSSFMAGFGVVGLVLQRGYQWDQGSLLPAAGGGLVFAYVLMAVFNKLAAAASGSSHAMVRELIGAQAEVTTPIGADAPGKIAYVLKGSRFSRSAHSANGQAIGRGQKVTIEAIEGNKTYVLKTD
ncbi:MAG: NfeD family protein [Planctomycetes bacterium]|nr:NfeD family protein [Planctomycetota bacterium]